MTQSVPSKKSPAAKPRLLPGLSVADGFTRHPFDIEFGVRTSGLVAGRHLKTGHRHDRHSTAYFGVAPSVLHALLARWQLSKRPAPLEEYTFVDIGAGMGRAVLVAAGYPFRAVVGVELHPGLVRTARRNLTQWRAAGGARTPMRIAACDAVEFKVPQGPCLAFLFNPFGATVLQRLLAGWSSAFAGRENLLDILYVNDEQASILEQNPCFHRMFRGKVSRSPADAIADHKIMANQPDGEYAASNSEHCSIYRWVGKPGSSAARASARR